MPAVLAQAVRIDKASARQAVLRTVYGRTTTERGEGDETLRDHRSEPGDLRGRAGVSRPPRDQDHGGRHLRRNARAFYRGIRLHGREDRDEHARDDPRGLDKSHRPHARGAQHRPDTTGMVPYGGDLSRSLASAAENLLHGPDDRGRSGHSRPRHPAGRHRAHRLRPLRAHMGHARLAHRLLRA